MITITVLGGPKDGEESMNHRVKVVWDLYTLRWRTYCYTCPHERLWKYWVFALAAANLHCEENQGLPF